MFAETGVRGEVVLLAVLEDEDAAGRKEARLQHEIGNVGKVGQGIGRVGEDEGESGGAARLAALRRVRAFGRVRLLRSG